MSANIVHGIIYKATCLVNGKMYIGATRNTLEKRMRSHKIHSKKSNYHFYNAIRKYGFDNFTWNIIAECATEIELSSQEKYYIKFYGSTDDAVGYNMSEGGVAPIMRGKLNGMFGKTHSEAVKLTARNRLLNKKWEDRYGKEMSDTIKAKLSASHTGRKNSAETLKKMSERSYWKNRGYLICGERNPNYGHKWSDELRAKASGSNNPMYKPIGEDVLRQIILLYKSGRSVGYIHRESGVGVKKIRNEIMSAGIKIRSASEQKRIDDKRGKHE